MEPLITELSTALLLAAIVLLLRRQRAAAKERDDFQAERLENVARNAELTQQTCLSALENLHKGLAALEQRTAAAERQLGSLIEAPAVERREHYEAAALLLDAGHGAARVAAMLDLPLAQVELMRELKGVLTAENTASSRREAQRSAKAVKKKSTGRSARAKAQPILLTEVVETDAEISADLLAACDGAAA